ncbi:Zinc finger and SCAN domain-containing protein 31 [Amphibalanus amphitrite]|uniref:Zinc finger and SCAN domain-containing protein 31 n=1 Tax=Amphibalanus amphitrite TaxID=1232801 RepID=A0A6A4X9P9_AMPAM|nr:Zinc finger and SCAN domain-containing protein 31 [Amphibalanus amphitrite]
MPGQDISTGEDDWSLDKGSGVPVAAAVHPCDQCPRQFRSAIALSTHRAVHRGETRCHLCGVVYCSRWYLRNHLASRHGITASPSGAGTAPQTAAGAGTAPYTTAGVGAPPHLPTGAPSPVGRLGRSWLPSWVTAPSAAAAASADSALRIHCPTCGRDFTQASYSQHVAMHRGRTTCHVCQAVYATRFGLRRHLAQRHPEHSADRAEGTAAP